MPSCNHLSHTTSLPGLELSKEFKLLKPGEWSDSEGTILVVTSWPNMSEVAATKLIEGKESILNSFLKKDIDPYYGERSQSETCKMENLPSVESSSSDSERERRAYYYATSNYVFGACSDIKDTLRAKVLWLYCLRSRTLFDIRIFVKKENSWPNDIVVHCAE
jgi:hypothetical protein